MADRPLPTAARPERVPTTATVARTQWLSPTLVRVVLTGEQLSALPELPFTDHYVKLRFGDAQRAYTIRWFDRAALELAIDFVVHGDQGLAGPWAAAAQPGDQVSFVGPGGAWAPAAHADVHLLVGDESALPAICVALERLGDHARAEVFIEVGSAQEQIELPAGPATHVTWVYRADHGDLYGPGLVRAVMEAPFPQGRVEAFVHGNADPVRALRRYLLKERGLDRSQVSISGYWRSGLTDEGWRAIKKEFNAAMDADLL